MQEIKSGKQLKRLRFYGWGVNKRLNMETQWMYGYCNHMFIDFSKVNYNKDYEIPTTSTLPENAKLVFHKTSKFPRHKLEVTTYKRKIKENLADYMVGNYKKFDLTNSFITYYKAYFTENSIYVVQDSDVTYEAICKEFPNLKDKIIDTVDNFKVLVLDKEQLLYLEYMEGEHTKPLISDRDLNKLVDGKSDKLTEGDIESIIELLISKDQENINLGAKLLTQFNLSATPCLTSLFLMLYHKYIQYSNARTSVVYKNLITEFPPQYESEYNIHNIINKYGFVDEEEKRLCRKLMVCRLLPDVEYVINNKNNLLKKFGVEVKYEVVVDA